MKTLRFSNLIAILGGIIIFSPLIFIIYGLINSGAHTRISELLSSERELGLLKRSVTIALGSATLSTIVGGALGFLFEKTDLPFKRIYKKIYLVPFLIPPYLQAILWITIFKPSFFQKVGGKLDVFTDYGAIFIYACSLFPLATLIISNGFSSIDREKEEVALLGSNKLNVLRRITLPLIYPHILVSFFIVFVLSLTNFEVCDTLRLPVYPLEIFINFSAFYDDQMAVLLAFPLIIITSLLLFIISLKMKGKSFSMLENGNRESFVFNLSGFKYLASGLCFLFFTLVVVLPLILLALKVPITSYWGYLLKNREVFIRTWTVAIFASLIITLVSYFICRVIIRSKGWMRPFFDILTLLPLGIPSIIVGISLIKMWNRPYWEVIYSSPIILVIGSLVTLSPFIIRVMYPAIHRIDKQLEEAASLSEKPFYFKILFIDLPLALPGLLSGFIISFVLFIGNIGVALLITPPGESTVPITIYNYMHYGSQEAVYALSILLLIIVVLTLIPLYVIKKWIERKR